MKYALHDLLRVRKARENDAMNAMIAARRRVDEAAAQVEDRKKELGDYIRRRTAKEERMYAEVLRREVRGRNLDDVRLQVQILRENELPFHDRIREAVGALEDASRELDEKTAAYRTAVRSRDKLDQHKNIWAEQARMEDERGEEKELEDFRARQEEDVTEAEHDERA